MPTKLIIFSSASSVRCAQYFTSASVAYCCHDCCYYRWKGASTFPLFASFPYFLIPPTEDVQRKQGNTVPFKRNETSFPAKRHPFLMAAAADRSWISRLLRLERLLMGVCVCAKFSSQVVRWKICHEPRMWTKKLSVQSSSVFSSCTQTTSCSLSVYRVHLARYLLYYLFIYMWFWIHYLKTLKIIMTFLIAENIK